MGAPPRTATLGSLLLTSALVLGACGSDADPGAAPTKGDPAARHERLRVVTTVSAITSLAAAVGGDLVEITGVVPEGTNSHTFEPAPSVAEVLAEADVVYLNGLQLEEPTRELAEANVDDDAEIVSLGEQTVTEDDYVFDFSFPESGGKPNPHLWTNPSMAVRYAEIIRDDLAERDPDRADTYHANFDAFEARVAAFDKALRTALDTVPVEHRKLLTYHDSFAYFAREYGWTVVGAIQVADFGDPTPKEVADLIGQVEDAGVPAIFGSEVFPSPVLETIGREAGVVYVDVLRDDDLPGEPGDAEHSWLGLMRFDYATIVSALGGDSSALESFDISLATADEAKYAQ